MDPSTMVVVIALIFASLFVVDRVTEVFKKRSFEEEQTKRHQASVEQFKDMTDKAVRTIQALHGGIAGDAVRTITPEGFEERPNGNGTGTVRYTQPGPAAAGFPQHRAAAAESR